MESQHLSSNCPKTHLVVNKLELVAENNKPQLLRTFFKRKYDKKKNNILTKLD